MNRLYLYSTGDHADITFLDITHFVEIVETNSFQEEKMRYFLPIVYHHEAEELCYIVLRYPSRIWNDVSSVFGSETWKTNAYRLFRLGKGIQTSYLCHQVEQKAYTVAQILVPSGEAMEKFLEETRIELQKSRVRLERSGVLNRS